MDDIKQTSIYDTVYTSCNGQSFPHIMESPSLESKKFINKQQFFEIREQE